MVLEKYLREHAEPQDRRVLSLRSAPDDQSLQRMLAGLGVQERQIAYDEF